MQQRENFQDFLKRVMGVGELFLGHSFIISSKLFFYNSSGFFPKPAICPTTPPSRLPPVAPLHLCAKEYSP